MLKLLTRDEISSSKLLGLRRSEERAANRKIRRLQDKDDANQDIQTVTPTLRFQTSLVNDDLTTDKPHKPLLTTRKRTGGRRNSGDLTIRHQGGATSRSCVSSTSSERSLSAGRVATIEYDPNRSARIALVHYADGEKRYILQPVD